MEMILRLLLRRLMALPVMILGVTALVFVVLQFTPGDPATVALGESASEAAKQLYRESHGLNDPLFVQYFRSTTLHVENGRFLHSPYRMISDYHNEFSSC